MATKFTVIRKDLQNDPVTLDNEGLTLGRLASSDLWLNHPLVSRTHAGIREIGSDFWITNLSAANGTLLNGTVVDSSPLAAGDLIQIGPFAIHVSFVNRVLTLTVEMSVNPLHSQNAGTSMLTPPDQAGKTMMLNPALLQQQMQKQTPGGTQRLPAATGKLTGLLSKPEEQALKVFWDKRKRDEGKMAERSLLKPNFVRGVGKTRLNWRPTTDLRRPWPASVFIWSTIVVAVVATVAAFVLKDSYSPGPLSSPHLKASLTGDDPMKAVAEKPNANACTTCHSLTTSMQTACSSCHTTAGFKPTVSHDHEMFGISCAECHGQEHQGDTFNQFQAKDTCVACHRENYTYKSLTTGQVTVLHTPHGGDAVGYPVKNGQWEWAGWSGDKWAKRNLPGKPAEYKAKEQFHLVHVANGDSYARVQCSDCHTVGFSGPALLQGVKESCARCHSATDATNVAQVTKSECTSCHQQHTSGKDPVALQRTRDLATNRTKN